MVEFVLFEDKKVLAKELAETIAGLLDKQIKDRGRAGLVVSGGSTPVPMFDVLSQQNIDWSKVWITLADERLVPVDHEDSNEAMVRAHLLKNRAKSANFVGLYSDGPDVEAECEKRLKAARFPFDILILGMGEDGHVASLFPRADRLDEAVTCSSEKLCKKIKPLSAPHERLTLTLPALLQAKHIFLHITGKKKKMVLAKAFQEGSLRQMPVRYVLRRATSPIKVYWAP